MPTTHLKDEVEPEQVPLNFIHLSHDTVQVVKYTVMDLSELYPDYQELQKFEIHQIVAEKSNNTLPFTPSSAEFVFFQQK